MKQPSNIKICIARFFISFSCPFTFFSGIQFLETEVNASANPPVSISAAVTSSARYGREERAKAVTITGPTTDVELIIAESNAYAVLKYVEGTMSFHSGLTERLIGGAVIPRINDVIRMDCAVSICFSVRIKNE